MIMKKIVFASLLLNGLHCYAIDDVRVNERRGLFFAEDKTVKIITTEYVGWNQKNGAWKWAGATVDVNHFLKGASTNDDTNYPGSTFTGKFSKLDISFTGSISRSPNQLIWNYEWNKKVDRPNAIGAGLEFRLNFDSPSFQKKPSEPILLANNKGWRWQTPDGKSIEVTFTPALAKLYFEKGQKNKIRAMFFTGIKKGTAKTQMTVKVSDGVSLKGPMLLNYDHVENYQTVKTRLEWHQDALPEIASPIDLSYLNKDHIPAGKHGFLTTKEGDLFFEDGTPVKFWGTSLMATALFSTSDVNIKRHAKRIAQLGFNLVRIHHHDSAWVKPNIFANQDDSTLMLSPASFKKLDWWIKCLKDEGIYVWLDLHVGREFTTNDNIEHFQDIAKNKKATQVKGFNYFNDSIQQRMLEFNEAYLSHENPFTKLAYKNDPGIVGVTITNENDLSYHFGNALLGAKGSKEHYQILLNTSKSFARQHGLDSNRIWHTWKMGESKIYLADMEHRFNKKLISGLKELGIKPLIATMPIWSKMGINTLPSVTDGDVILAHSYGVPEEIRYNPRYNPSMFAVPTGSQVAGYPLIVAEWNIEPFPARDRVSVPLFAASVGSLQSWDGMVIYGYSHHPLNSWKKGDNYSTYNDPSLIGLMPAGALLYRENHVSEANTTYLLKPNRQDLFFKGYSAYTSQTIRTLLETSRVVIDLPNISELPWLAKNTANRKDSRKTITITDFNKDFIPKNQDFVESDTKELKRNWEKGYQTINTPKSQAVIGWVGDEELNLNNVNFSIKTKKAVVAVQSLQNKPLVDSTEIFITALARSKPLHDNGKLPFMSEPVVGELKIQAPEGLKLYPITPGATKGEAIETNYINGEYIVDLKAAKTHWYVLK